MATFVSALYAFFGQWSMTTLVLGALAVALVLWEIRIRWQLRFMGKPAHSVSNYPFIGGMIEAAKGSANDAILPLLHNAVKGNNFETTCFRIADQIFVIGTTPKHVGHLFGPAFHNYVKGPKIAAVFEEILGHGIFTTDGGDWKEYRHVASHLFTAQQLKIRMRAVFERRARQLSSIVRSHVADRSVFDMQRLMYCFTFDVINEIAFGRAVDSLGGDAVDRSFQEAFDLGQHISATRIIEPPAVWKLRRFCGAGQERDMVLAVKEINEYLGRVYDERDESGGDSEGDGSDLITLFYESCEREGRQPSAKEVRDLIMSFVIAGRDTTASLLTWTFYLLSKNPDICSSLRADIIAHDGDYDGMHMAQAVLQEALRLYPSVPLEFKFAKSNDVLPCGTWVKAGTAVLFNPYTFNRNPANFVDPDMFLPKRWLNEDGSCRKYDLQGFSYPAFNAGPRVCLGRNMAMLEAKIVLAYLIPDFNIALEDGFEPEQKFTVVLACKNGLRVTATARK